MCKLFRGPLWRNLLVYLEDILLFSQTFDQHVEHLQEVFDRIKGAKLKLHPAKCDFFAHEVHYLGHKLSSDGVRPLESKQIKLQDWPKPTNQKQLRHYIDFVTYYKRFCRSFSKLCGPLYELLQKDVPFLWTEAADKAFCDIRDALVNAPLLHHPDFQKDFIVSCDASTYAIGYALSQLDNKNKEVPICFSGRALSKHQRNYSISEIRGFGPGDGLCVNGIHTWQIEGL